MELAPVRLSKVLSQRGLCSRLEADDYILFVDFAPPKRPNDNLRFSYTGHWSQAGMWGATLEPHEVHGLDLNTLEWTPGIPE